MKSFKHICLYAVTALAGLAMLPSCTNLDEEIYSEVISENYYESGDQVIAAMMRPWGHFCGTLSPNNSVWKWQELTADGAAWPQKGRHGYDNGNWIRMHRHQWTPTDTELEQAWNLLYMGVGFANNLLADFERLDFERLNPGISKEQAMAEMRVYRAYCYAYLLDMFGDIPITESLDETNPPAVPRAEAFDYVVKELTENIPSLSDNKTTTYGRVSKWGATTLLAHLYLNAEVYTGTARWDDCIAACDEVINSGQFRLDEHWNDPFKVDNDKNSQENIWVIVYDEIYAAGMNWYTLWFHYAMQAGWELEGGPWNGLVTQPTFYDSFADNDLRKTEGFLIGVQYPRVQREDGSYYFDTDAEPLKGSEEYVGQPLEFVNYIKSLTEGEENSGARSIKYEVVNGARGDMSNDWVLFRYADVLFMKAEALMRKNGGTATQEVVDLVNSVRQRAFAPEDWEAAKYTTTTLTMDEFLAERGREFAFEGLRRQDLIRFNKFIETSWWDKSSTTDETRKIFPIPYKKLQANPALGEGNAANKTF